MAMVKYDQVSELPLCVWAQPTHSDDRRRERRLALSRARRGQYLFLFGGAG